MTTLFDLAQYVTPTKKGIDPYCDELVLDWWKNKSKNYVLDDLFSLDSDKRNELVFKVNRPI